ncbi:hypothetical protein JVU11DRAFT_5204 [Chiua virens]|nr:hypothetical protein JVU11DRAFT_5204 [Chiua virens]
MSENNSFPILNPIVYLNYLDPSTASEYEAARNLFLVTLGALTWDILSSLPDDWIIIRTTKFSAVICAYFSSSYITPFSLAGPIENCGVMELILAVFWVFASGSSSFLFLRRVHAVFYQERLVRHVFTVLWVGGVGASLVMFPGLLHDYYQIADTKHCTNYKIQSYVSAAFIAPSMFDMLVYLAISYKILTSHPTTKSKSRSWTFFCRKYRNKALPRFSRAVLQGGQQYYMITDGVNVTRTVLALSSNVSPILQLAPSVPAIALTCAMACRVFRNLKLETLQNTEVVNLTTVQFEDREPITVHLTKNTDTGGSLHQV